MMSNMNTWLFYLYISSGQVVIELLLVCKMLRVSLVLCSVLCVVLAAQSLGPLEPKPEKFSNVPGCYIKDLDQVIPVGQAAPSRTSCMEYRCGEAFISYITCGAVYVEPPFELVEDKTKPYPGCCPTIKNP